ncbi:MAG TPA: hypothetical protein VFR13_03190 [Jiangellaceae bacterium]|nr:hypothetical protein [Jiangellaceae bacterium]
MIVPQVGEPAPLCEPTFYLRVLADREGIGFALLADLGPHGAVARAYGGRDISRWWPVLDELMAA